MCKPMGASVIVGLVHVLVTVNKYANTPLSDGQDSENWPHHLEKGVGLNMCKISEWPYIHKSIIP